VDRILTLLRLLPERPEIFPAWRRIVSEYRVSGLQVHDARIVAAMKAYQIRTILTFDLSDFKRYAGVTVVHPTEVP
jgi:predicted nucleic acid-binding protein